MPAALVRWLQAPPSFPNLMKGPLPGPAHPHLLRFQLLLKLLQTLGFRTSPIFSKKKKKVDSLKNAFTLPFQLCCRAFGILVAQPGIEPMPPEVKAPSLNPWTTREVPGCLVFIGSRLNRLWRPSHHSSCPSPQRHYEGEGRWWCALSSSKLSSIR